ncbi:hypothetical protein, partial [Enterococcus faecium]
MLKKINAVLSLFVCITILFFSTNVINGIKTSEALYKNTAEIHMQYKDDMDFNSYINALYEISTQENINISQYSFTAVNQLTILATNPNANKHWKFSKKNILARNDSKVHYTNNKNSKYQLKLPNNFLNINIYPFSHVENIGLSEILYVQGNSNKLIPVLKKYGTPTISNINQSDTFQINTNIVLVICYLSIFIVITTIIFAFSKMKEITLKKMLGYNSFDTIKDSIKELNLLFCSLIITFILSIFLSIYYSNENFFLSFLLCSIFHFIISFLFIIVTLSIYHLSSIKNYLKNSRPLKLNLCILNICLFLSMILLLIASTKVINTHNEAENNSLKYWERTTNLYKTNITNQLNRNNTVEENNYLKKASKFVYKIQKNYKTFIIAPYNYATIQENNKEFFIGQKVYPNFEDYVSQPAGAGICVDLNYLKYYNPISFEESTDLNLINSDPLTTYILVPKKYKEYAKMIEKNYLEDIQFRLEDSPPQAPYKNPNLKNLKIKLIFVNNNQKYFSFNTLYGKAKDNYTITDPIVRVINPEITESLFWGNILTSDGGLFFDQKHTSNQNFFNQINPYIKEFNLENIINFSYSVFQETGELLSQKKVNKLNAYLQYLLILGLFIIINFQMIFVSFTINSKKIALKKIFGYS